MDRGQRAAVPHAIDGYHGLVDAFFAMAMDGDALDLPGETARVHRYLQAHSRIFPFSAPLAHRMSGWRNWATGNRIAGLRAWRKAVGAAAQLGMWHEVARLHQHLARFSPDAAEAARSSAIASAILSSLRTTGCATGPQRGRGDSVPSPVAAKPAGAHSPARFARPRAARAEYAS